MSGYIASFNGERMDLVSGHYHLGNGYRAFIPVLGRFTCPDSMSPFGAGSINPYAYCAGAPVNNADPTGHLSWQAWLGIGMGIVGVGLALFTSGASIAAAGGIMAAIESASTVSLAVGTLGMISDVTAIGSGTVEESNPQTSAILGWVSVGTGAVGLAHGLYSAGTRGARALNSLTGGLRQRLGNIQIAGLSGRGASAAGRAMAESTGSMFTNPDYISRARNIPFNYGIGNCEFVAQRTFGTLLTGIIPSGVGNFFTSTYESIYGMRNAIDNCYAFRRIIPPAEKYETLLRELIPSYGPFPEISSLTFSSRSAMMRKLNEAQPFSVFLASSKGQFMGMSTEHAFIVARGESSGDYSIFDKYSAYSHHIATNYPDRYFETFFHEFEVELTGFWN